MATIEQRAITLLNEIVQDHLRHKRRDVEHVPLGTIRQEYLARACSLLVDAIQENENALEEAARA